MKEKLPKNNTDWEVPRLAMTRKIQTLVIWSRSTPNGGKTQKSSGQYPKRKSGKSKSEIKTLMTLRSGTISEAAKLNKCEI